MKYARIENDVVVEIIENAPAEIEDRDANGKPFMRPTTREDLFHPDLEIVPAGKLRLGYVRKGDAFVPPSKKDT